MVELGLLECVYNREEKEVSEIVKVMKSKLFDNFIKLNL